MARQKFQSAFKKYFISNCSKQYYTMFETLKSANKQDMQKAIDSFTSKVFYEQIKSFLCTKGYVLEENLILLKQDPHTMLNLYRIYGIHYCVYQQDSLVEKLKQKKKKKHKGPKDPAELDESDYSDEDFTDLMSNQQIEQSIRVFFDRMHELINPIDSERLKLDSVHQVKNDVKQFYKKKSEQCDKLL